MKFLICLFLFSLCLYQTIHRHNHLTELRLRLPDLSNELALLQEQNRRLDFELERFEDPSYLMSLLPHYSHLQHPREEEIWDIES